MLLFHSNNVPKLSLCFLFVLLVCAKSKFTLKTWLKILGQQTCTIAVSRDDEVVNLRFVSAKCVIRNEAEQGKFFIQGTGEASK